jgi:hypothetical protein
MTNIFVVFVIRSVEAKYWYKLKLFAIYKAYGTIC